MNKNQLLILFAAVGLTFLVLSGPADSPPPDKPTPVNPEPGPCPGPGPCPLPKPKPKPKPWGMALGTPVGVNDLQACKCCVECKCVKCACSLAPKGCCKCCPCAFGYQAKLEAKVGGPVSPDGTPIQINLPGRLHMKNSGGIGPGGPGTGAGLCVFTSIEHAAIWQNIPELLGLQKWMEHKPGGGYPTKVDKMLAEFCKEKGVTVPRYLQVQNKDLDILRLATRTGRLPCITYSVSATGRYGGQRIYHMTNAPHCADDWFAVLDNNYPGEDKYEWLTPAEFARTYAYDGSGWAVIFLGAAPPPPPRNLP